MITHAPRGSGVRGHVTVLRCGRKVGGGKVWTTTDDMAHDDRHPNPRARSARRTPPGATVLELACCSPTMTMGCRRWKRCLKVTPARSLARRCPATAMQRSKCSGQRPLTDGRIIIKVSR
jgi:hypothetical protein